MSLCRLPIELHTQSWSRGRQQVTILPLWLNRDDVGQERSWPVGLFLDTELYVVRFAYGGDLLRFGDAPSDTQVNADVVYPLLLHELPELPFGAKLLPGGQGHGGAKPQQLVRPGVLRAQGVF